MSDDYHRLQEVTRPDFRRINKGKVGDRFVDSNAGKEIHEKSTRGPARKTWAPLEAKPASSSEMSDEEDYLKGFSVLGQKKKTQKKKTVRTNEPKPKKVLSLHDRLILDIDESPRRSATNVLNEFKEKFTELQEKTQNEIIQIQQRGDIGTTAVQHKLEQDKLRDVIADIQKQFVAMGNFLQLVSDTTEFKENTILLLGGMKNDHTEYAGAAILASDKQRWIELELELPYRARGSGAVSLNGEIYLFGGIRNSRELYKLGKNLQWERLSDNDDRVLWL